MSTLHVLGLGASTRTSRVDCGTYIRRRQPKSLGQPIISELAGDALHISQNRDRNVKILSAGHLSNSPTTTTTAIRVVRTPVLSLRNTQATCDQDLICNRTVYVQSSAKCPTNPSGTRALAPTARELALGTFTSRKCEVDGGQQLG